MRHQNEKGNDVSELFQQDNIQFDNSRNEEQEKNNQKIATFNYNSIISQNQKRQSIIKETENILNNLFEEENPLNEENKTDKILKELPNTTESIQGIKSNLNQIEYMKDGSSIEEFSPFSSDENEKIEQINNGDQNKLDLMVIDNEINNNELDQRSNLKEDEKKIQQAKWFQNVSSQTIVEWKCLPISVEQTINKKAESEDLTFLLGDQYNTKVFSLQNKIVPRFIPEPLYPLKQNDKLNLVIDLDHTLVEAIDIGSKEYKSEKLDKIIADKDIIDFKIDKVQFKLIIRKYALQFVKNVSTFANLFIYSAAQRSYVEYIIYNYFDKNNKLIQNKNIISGKTEDHQKKSLKL